MGKFNKGANPDKQMFFDTIKDMRKLIQKNTKSYHADTMGLGKKVKVPYNHLQGRRNVIKQQHKNEKSRAHQESIQYDSNMKLLNSEIMEKKREKDEFERNKYKYSGIEGGRVGRENDQGFLEITKKDIDRIYGKHEKQNKTFNKKSSFKGKGKGKGKGFKNKKGGKGGKGGKNRK